jgi:hypothetical protein
MKIITRSTSWTAIPILLLLSFPIWSYPKVSGLLDTTVYTYSTENEELSGTESSYRIHEGVILDIDFSERFSFHTNNRITYRTNELEDSEQLDLNLYYGYLDCQMGTTTMQVGRIMDVNNLIFTCYDGARVQHGFTLSKHRFTVDLYGGLMVNDDYLEDEKYPYGFNSFDYRNLFIEQRQGDYIGGAKANVLARGIGIFSIDYQMIYNDSALAEQYVSCDFDTLFSKRIKFYGYGTFDLIEPSPSNTMVASRIQVVESLSVILEHEYYRPVYIKDSYFWSYFKPYGSQEVSALLIYAITPAMIADVRYGKILYDGDDETGDEISGSFEHRGFFDFSMKVTTEYITGPEGDRLTAQIFLKRRIFKLDALAGGGVVYYSEDELDSFSTAYFAILGADMKALENVMLSATGEYYNNPNYTYDLRGLFSVKYIF